MQKVMALYLKILVGLEKFFLPLLIFFMRFWMARIFWYSGLVKISSWQSTLFLFQHEYKVPIIPPELAAYFATAIELSCPILLVFGIATRFATLPMLAMTAVIQFTYLHLIDHFYWAILLGTILLYGPGTLSIDYWIRRKMALLRTT